MRKHKQKLIVVLLMLGSLLLGALVVLVTPLRFANIVEPKITEISPTDFYAEFKQNPNDYIFIDVRPQDQYMSEHPVGAVNVPLEKLYNQRHFLPKQGKTIALICGGNQASGIAFSYLQHFGFYNIVRVTGGLPAWKAAGLPTANGSNPYGDQASTTAAVSMQIYSVKCT